MMCADGARIRIGTSGWSYDEWIGPFYPDGAASGDLLDHYAATFDTVEINNSFYQLPDGRTLAAWRDRVPSSFVFTAKASRFVTHMKKLKDPEDGLRTFLDRIEILGDRLGPILLQLPPDWHRNLERLEHFLAAASRDFRYAFEFRDRSWLTDETLDLLRDHEAALCIYDYDGFRSPSEVTTDFVYVRLHGPDGPYRGSYDASALSGWAGAFSSWAAKGLHVYCYFDNDQEANAPRDAARLLEMAAA